MDTMYLILILLAIVALGGLMIWLQTRQSPLAPSIDPAEIKLLQQRLELLNQDMKSSLTESARMQQTSSHHMTGVVRDHNVVGVYGFSVRCLQD